MFDSVSERIILVCIINGENKLFVQCYLSIILGVLSTFNLIYKKVHNSKCILRLHMLVCHCNVIYCYFINISVSPLVTHGQLGVSKRRNSLKTI